MSLHDLIRCETCRHPRHAHAWNGYAKDGTGNGLYGHCRIMKDGTRCDCSKFKDTWKEKDENDG